MDIVIDAFADDTLQGMPTLDNAINVLKNNGMIVSYGHPQNRRMIDVVEFQKKCITMRGPVNEITKIRDYYKKAINFINDGTLDVRSLITGRVPLEKVTEGIKQIVQYPEKNLKILVDI